ncbi:glycoside hydrolase family 25 protein [Streptomyces olivoreticuli]
MPNLIGEMMLNGIDISSYQSATPDTSGLDFLFIKVTEGTSYVNPEWESQYQAGKAAGLVLGKYHYPNIGADPVTEADYFLSKADVQSGDVLILDWEWDGAVSNSVADAYKQQWLQHVKSQMPTHKVILYSNLTDWKTVDSDSYCQDGLWIADYVTAGQPRIQHPWLFHQYSDSGGLDQNVANFSTAADLKAWAGAQAAPQPGGDYHTEPGFPFWAYKNPLSGPDAWAKLSALYTAVQELQATTQAILHKVSQGGA